MNDILVDSVSRDVIRFSLDTALPSLDGIDDYNTLKYNADNLLKLNNVRNIIRSTYNSNFRLQSIYVYLENANYIITSGDEGIVLKQEFNDMGWLKAYNEEKDLSTGTIWLNSRRIGNGDSEGIKNPSAVNVLTFVLPLKNLSLKMDGAIVVNVNEKELSNLINTTDLTNNYGYVLIMNKNGDVISHIDKSLVSKNIKKEDYVKKIINSKENSGYLIDSLDSKRQLIAYNKTEFNDWIYVGVFPLSDLMNNTNQLRIRIAAILILIIVLGVGLSYFMSRRIYNPLNALVQQVKNKKGIDLKDNEKENEIALLTRAFSAIDKQEAYLLDLVEKNKTSLEEQYLTNILKGYVDRWNNEDYYKIEFPYKYFMCSILSIDNYKAFRENYLKDQQYYMKILIIKACEESLTQYYKCESLLYDDNKMVIIINYNDDDKSKAITNINEQYRKVQEEVSKILENTITISNGGEYSNLLGIQASFMEALEAQKQKLVLGEGKIINYYDVIAKENKYFYPSNFEKHIINNLNLGLKQETIEAVNILIKEIRSRSYISPDNIMQIFIQLAGNTMKFIMDRNINISDIFDHDYNIYQSLAGKETIEEIRVELIDFYSRIFDNTLKSEGDAKDVKNKVFKFIKDNLKNNIDVTAIADYVGISYSYVRKIVKDKSGKTVVDYINGLKIEEAKRLLKDTNMNMNDIALQVGYNNYQSFNRFFQKYEGVTPSEFRNV
jgi:AraC-type DNA-binding domain-containing proteins